MEAEDWGRTEVHSGEIMAYDDWYLERELKTGRFFLQVKCCTK